MEFSDELTTIISRDDLPVSVTLGKLPYICQYFKIIFSYGDSNSNKLQLVITVMSDPYFC